MLTAAAVFFQGCRFTSPDQGSLAVVLAPVLRFLDVGLNANLSQRWSLGCCRFTSPDQGSLAVVVAPVLV